MQKIFLVLLYIASFSIFFSCESSQENNPTIVTDPTTLEVSKEEKPQEEKENYTITTTAFGKLKLGAKAADVANLEKGILESGEGTFDVYYLKSADGKALAYAIPHHEDESIVDQIFVTSPLGKTEQGIHVGMTYGAFEKIITDFEVHGSEIEARTYIDDNQFSYRLNVNNGSYDVDKSTISKEAKIMEIILQTK